MAIEQTRTLLNHILFQDYNILEEIKERIKPVGQSHLLFPLNSDGSASG